MRCLPAEATVIRVCTCQRRRTHNQWKVFSPVVFPSPSSRSFFFPVLNSLEDFPFYILNPISHELLDRLIVPHLFVSKIHALFLVEWEMVKLKVWIRVVERIVYTIILIPPRNEISVTWCGMDCWGVARYSVQRNNNKLWMDKGSWSRGLYFQIYRKWYPKSAIQL